MLRFALHIFSGKIILNFGFQESLRTFLKPIFTEGVVEGNGYLHTLPGSPSQSKPSGFASSPKGGALGMAVQFPV